MDGMPQSDTNLDTLIIDTIGSIVMVCDRQGRIIRFNHAATRILGYSAEEVMGKTMCDIFPLPENQERCRERFAQTLAGGTFEFDSIWRTRSGDHRLHFLHLPGRDWTRWNVRIFGWHRHRYHRTCGGGEGAGRS